jgi:4-hydroxyphenylpyruvate dioxygenase
MSASMNTNPARESLQDDRNPMQIEGVEYVEYRTSQPQQLGQVLELMGFRPVARHRSREVLLYRQGDMNIVINAHGGSEAQAVPLPKEPQVAAFALRVRDAAAAHRRALTLGAWDVPSKVAPMELHIPAIHGVGTSRIYFVDRHREFSIYSVDFVPIPGVDPHPLALAGMRWFGIVQYIGAERTNDWVAFYQSLFGFTELGADRSTGVLPSGCVLASPDGSLQLQLIEPPADLDDGMERLHRLALAAADVPAAAAALRERGVSFVQTKQLSVQPRGALTQAWLGSVMFELVHADAQPEPTTPASTRHA